MLQVVGGLLLVWIAVKLVRQADGTDAHGNIRHGTTLLEAIWIIIVADVIMSLDNVIAVAGAAEGDLVLALHPVCSLIKLGLAPKLEQIALACSDTATVPLHAGCCGFAGDRGFLFPELTAAATWREAEEVRGGRHDGYFSSSRTCEIGMTRATGKVYRSYIYLLEQATRQGSLG